MLFSLPSCGQNLWFMFVNFIFWIFEKTFQFQVSESETPSLHLISRVWLGLYWFLRTFLWHLLAYSWLLYQSAYWLLKEAVVYSLLNTTHNFPITYWTSRWQVVWDVQQGSHRPGRSGNFVGQGRVQEFRWKSGIILNKVIALDFLCVLQYFITVWAVNIMIASNSCFICASCAYSPKTTPCFKKTSTHIIGYKLRNSCPILIIFDINIPHIIWHPEIA